MDNRQAVFNMLVNELHVPPQNAIGAIYGLAGESGAGLNTGAYNPNDPGGSYGLGQWNGPRKTAMWALADKMGVPRTDFGAQNAYLKSELLGPENATLRALQNASDTRDATGIWVNKFERPSVDNSGQRYQRGVANIGSLTPDNQIAGGNGQQVPTTAPQIPGTTLTSANIPQQPTPVPGTQPTAPGPQPTAPTPAATPAPTLSSKLTDLAALIGKQPQQQAAAPPAAMAPPNLDTNSAGIAAASPQLMAQLLAQKKIPGLTLGGYDGMV